jgi:N-acetylglucosaminyl-diphospho-decaprenol L-rhamnosyltransferase
VTVDIIIVNWNGGPELVSAVRSALQFGGRPIVVDNASSQQAALREVAEMPGVTVARQATNLGFAVGCNSGVRAGNGDVVMLLNPDAEIITGTATDLEQALTTSGAMLVGMRLQDVAGSPVPPIRPLPGAIDLIADLLRVQSILKRVTGREASRFEARAGDRERGWIVGAALAMRRVDWDHLGGMDERFFLWYEDVDLGARVSRAGGTVALVPEVLIRHLGASTWNRLPRRRRQWLRVRGAVHYARENLNRGAVAALLAAALPALAIGIGLDVVHWLTRRP